MINQQAVDQIAEKGDLTLNRDTNQSVSLNANGQRVLTVRGVDNVTNLKKNSNGLTFNANNGGLYITLGKSQPNSLGNHLPFNQSETEQALLNDTKKNSDVLYFGKIIQLFHHLKTLDIFKLLENGVINTITCNEALELEAHLLEIKVLV